MRPPPLFPPPVYASEHCIVDTYTPHPPAVTWFIGDPDDGYGSPNWPSREAMIADLTAALAALTADSELERLRRWKAEAMIVLGEWERVWEVAGRPGRLGASKAAAVRRLLEGHDADARPD